MTIRCAFVLALALSTVACGGTNSSSSPTAPTGPTPNSPVRYTALGASDAIGVGASTPCTVFAPCENGTGYVPLFARQLRSGREVTVLNMGIPAAVVSPAMQTLGRQYGRDILSNFLDQQLPFVPGDSTLITVFGGANDVNALGDAAQKGAAGSDIKGFLDSQIRVFGNDYDRLVQGLRARAPNALLILINIPNMAALPYSAGYPLIARQGLQYISVGFTREVNRHAGNRTLVLDAMCDPDTYGTSRFSSDGFHPNDAGYAYLAQRLLTTFNNGSSSASSACAQMSVVPALQ